MRATVLKRFHGRREGWVAKTLLPLGCTVNLDDNDPKTAGLIASGHVAPIGTVEAKPVQPAPRASEPVEATHSGEPTKPSKRSRKTDS